MCRMSLELIYQMKKCFLENKYERVKETLAEAMRDRTRARDGCREKERWEERQRLEIEKEMEKEIEKNRGQEIRHITLKGIKLRKEKNNMVRRSKESHF